MSKRITVFVNQDLFNLIDFYCKNEDISVAAFARKIGKHNRWVSEVKRGRNLPSPEEAARMCILLNTTPEEILLHEGANEAETAKCQKDIAYVRSLVEKKRAEGIKIERPADGEALGAKKQALIDEIYSMTDEQCERLFGIIQEAKKLL